MYVESRKMVQMILFAKQKQRHRHRKQMYRYQGGGKVEATARLGLTHLPLLRPYGLYSLPGSSVHVILQARILE